MASTSTPVIPYAWRAFILLFTIEIAYVSTVRYFIGSETPPTLIVDNAFANPFLVLHAAGGVVALVLAPLQFVQVVRRKWPAVHRAVGYLSLAACAVAAPAGLMLAIGTTAGQVAAVGFAIPALLWPTFAWLGWRAAVDRRFDDHRRWMLRMYAIVATAITLRLMLPAAGLMQLDFLPAYRAIAWLSWSTTLLLFEVYIRRSKAFTPMGQGDGRESRRTAARNSARA